jgi:VWFA-related protein
MPAVFGLMCLIAAGHPTAQEHKDAAEPSGTIRLHTVALDRDGRPVMDLKPDELEVWIGQYRIPISRVTAIAGDDRAVRTIALLLDDITQDPTASPRVREAGRPFVNRMAPGDLLAIATLNRTTVEFTEDPAQALKGLDSHFGGYGIVPAGDVADLMFNRIIGLSRAMAERPGRKAIVAIGGAWLFDTPIHPMAFGRDLRREWTEAMRALAAAEASVYVLDPAGLGAARVGRGDNGFARETGGHAFVNSNDLRAAADRILEELDNHYVIEIGDPPVLRKSDLREVDVRTSRKDVTVRARRWIPGR